MNHPKQSKQYRCDVCRLKAELEPQSLYDVLCWLSPPVELIDAVERWSKMKQLPQPVLDWLDRWRRLRTDEPVPEVDRFGVQGKLAQGKLLDVRGPSTYA
ncbi:hypothetical protein [Caldilinea sp.]|uniref:hypothetical protein n=1 Tax=Caldilinea sp. TaxID=2293560 RepID=UPI0021DDA787|nr:hypothetical protein [Caldilinea sp.]GIV73516.1 MAG: hypothetical protein KatS3mg049_2072 [Caldilinea sp.]